MANKETSNINEEEVVKKETKQTTASKKKNSTVNSKNADKKTTTVKKETKQTTKEQKNNLDTNNEEKNNIEKSTNKTKKSYTQTESNTSANEKENKSQTKDVESEITNQKTTVEEKSANKNAETIINIFKSDGSFKTIEVIGLVIITCVVSLILGSLVTSGFKNSENKFVEDEYLNKIIETYEYIKQNYYGDIDNEKMIKATIEAMIGTLNDPYSTFFDESSAKNFNITLNGNYQGLGVEISNNAEGNIQVMKVFNNSPAKNAGMQVGDVIASVNNISYLGKTTSEFVSVVRDGLETDFTVVVQRDGEQISLNIKKDNIVIESVHSKIFKDNNKKIGYIDVDIFASNTFEQFKNKLEELEKENIDALILDLRDNTGGHLSAAKDMLSLFLDSKHVIYQTETKNKIEKFYSKGKQTKKYKIVVLGNSLSASASEIVIAALKDEYGAKFVGGSTFGKGTVQELHELPTGEQYKFTTKRWLTPKGDWINGHGITPDYVLYPSEAYIENPIESNDNILKKALELLR